MKTYIVVEKNSIRVIAHIDSMFKPWFEKNLPLFDIFEVRSAGSSSFTFEDVTIFTYSFDVVNSNEDYHMIKSMSNENYDLEKGYKLLNQ